MKIQPLLFSLSRKILWGFSGFRITEQERQDYKLSEHHKVATNILEY